MRLKILTATAVVAVALFAAFKAVDKRTVFMIGDSTMANKSLSGGNLERGWGMALQCCFDDKVIIDNHAVNGRSSKSFIDEGRWQVVLDRITPGDYVIIQFGHNDEKPKADRHTDPGSTFDANLTKFVRETRERGGVPILMNCVVRRNFQKHAPGCDDDEALRQTVGAPPSNPADEGDILVDTHGDYRTAPRNVAKAENVIFVDANKITHDLEQGLGREESKKLHMWFLPGEEKSVPKGRQDNTHYRVHGAQVVARLLAEAVCSQVPELKRHLVKRDLSVDSLGRGDWFTPQEAVDNAPDGRRTTIQLFAGKWTKPEVPKTKKVKFVLREGAEWK